MLVFSLLPVFTVVLVVLLLQMFTLSYGSNLVLVFFVGVVYFYEIMKNFRS